jgi:DNA-binding MarR family transcriptional regulator
VQETVAPAQLAAEQLLIIWQHLMRGTATAALAEIEQHDLGLVQVKTLDALAIGETDPTVKDLAERLGLSLPGMSRNVDGLERRGLLDRREDERDRRMKRLKLTAAGREVLDRVNAARLQGLEEFTASLPREQSERLAAALAPITEGLR